MTKQYQHIGIDPGINGAIALLRTDGTVAVMDMPTKSVGDKGKKVIDGHRLSWQIRAWREESPLIVTVEKVHAMPGQGVTSCFNFGRTFGTIWGILDALEQEIHLVTGQVLPSVWKKALAVKAGKTQKEKSENSRQRVQELLPNADPILFKLAKHHDRAEAAMIALWAKQNTSQAMDGQDG